MSDSSAADLTLTFATRAYKRVDQFPVLLTMIAINEKEAEPMVDGLYAAEDGLVTRRDIAVRGL